MFAQRRARWRARMAERAAAWSRRRQGVDRFPIEITRRRLYILPTRAGLGFSALLVVMGIAGLNYANSLALLIAFVLGGFVLVAMNLCHRNLQGLRVEGLIAHPTFEGDIAKIEVAIANDLREARLGIDAAADASTPSIAELAAGTTQRIELRLPARRRGRQALPRIRISTRFPFGLFRAWTWLHAEETLLVYPVSRGALAMPVGSNDRSDGTSTRQAGNDEWAGLRGFREGDSPRQVAWKVYARGLPLLVKEYTGGSSQVLHFDFATLPGASAEARLQQLSRWIVDAEARGQRYALTVPARHIADSRGALHRHRCLEALALHGLPRESTHA